MEAPLINTKETNGAQNQVVATVAPASLWVFLIVTITILFGKVKHQNATLILKALETQKDIAAITSLWNELNRFNLDEKVTFATMNILFKH